MPGDIYFLIFRLSLDIIWIPAICISIGAAIGAQIGAKLSKKTKSKVILMLLSLAMFALGIRLILLGSAH